MAKDPGGLKKRFSKACGGKAGRGAKRSGPGGGNARRTIPIEETPRPEVLKRMTSEAWKAVDARAREEIARRRPPTQLVGRAGTIADILEREFPKARSALNYSTPLELLVATILSAQCTDARVNQVTPAVFRRYPTAAAYAESPPGELEEAIRSTGFFNSKAKSIRACCRELVDKHGGKVPREVESLASLPGVGRKTAAVVRSNVFDLPGLAVDTHFQRISRRLGLTDDQDPVRIEFDVGSLLPAERWSTFGHAVILHGRKTCTARKPACPGCPVRDLCPSADTLGS